MKSYCLNIAGYKIRIESDKGSPGLEPSLRFIKSLVSDKNFDVLIKVRRGHFVLPASAERVFHAPLVEEINDKTQMVSNEFWSVYRQGNNRLYIKTVFPRTEGQESGTVIFSFNSRKWDLWIQGRNEKIDPMAYPLDGLLLYYLTIIFGDIMIHASGVNHDGRGFIFSGMSGRGKSTMANLWKRAGATVIHDDRLIIRRNQSEYYFYNTPVYDDDEPLRSRLHRIYLIEHGYENKINPVHGASAVSLVLANCIQHNWHSEIIARLVGAVSLMCENISVMKLSFKPEKNVIDFILSYD
ncbi:MAG: hypothetical protein ACUVTX_01430 [Bacteroidales bacterium]